MLAVGVLFVASEALAVPLGPGATRQKWTFDDNDNPAIPEIDLNPFGTPTATILGGVSGPAPLWVADALGRSGVWKGRQVIDITLDIPNQMVRNPYKLIHLEIGFIGDLSAFSVWPTPGADVVELVSQKVEIVNGTTGWKKLTAEWYIEPNPDSESVCYAFSADKVALDYIDVYTVCRVPEPLTIALLGFGGLMLRRHRQTA